MQLGTEVGLSPGNFVLDRNPALPSPKKAEPSPIFGPRLLWPNGRMDQDGTWHGGGPRSKPHRARWGPRSPKKGGTAPPIFGPCLLWPNGCMHHDTTWYADRPQPRRHCVRWGPCSPSPKGAQPSQISGHVRCGQTAGWTKMPLGMELGLDPGDFVLYGDPAPLKGAQPPPAFGPYILWPSGWMDEDAAWYGSRLRPSPHCVRRGPCCPREKGTAAPSFRPMSVVATIAHLSYC